MIPGKTLRLKRLIDGNSGKTIIVPMDHCLTMGPVKGLEDISKAYSSVAMGGANAVVIHKGMLSHIDEKNLDSGVVIHLSGATCLGPDPLNKISVCDVEEALSLGADGVSVHVNIGADNEGSMLKFFGKTVKECSRWGMPVLAMMYPRGRNIKEVTKNIKIAARVGAEIGADLIKCPYTGDCESFFEVIEGCPVPVVIAGGERKNDEKTLKMIEGAIKSGAAGISMGRNIFQHENPELFIKAASLIVHNLSSAKEAHEFLNAFTNKTSDLLSKDKLKGNILKASA